METELNTVNTRLRAVEAENQILQQNVEDKDKLLQERESVTQTSTGQVASLQEVYVSSEAAV